MRFRLQIKGSVTDFRKAVQAKDDEVIVLSWVEWLDKATRDAAMAKMKSEDFKGDRIDQEKNTMPFDGKRMIFAGIESVLMSIRQIHALGKYSPL